MCGLAALVGYSEQMSERIEDWPIHAADCAMVTSHHLTCTCGVTSWAVQAAKRLAEAEAIIRAKNRLEQAMYDSDSEASWPRDADALERAYQQRYGVDLSGVEQRQ